jgi:hypothetical protein
MDVDCFHCSASALQWKKVETLAQRYGITIALALPRCGPDHCKPRILKVKFAPPGRGTVGKDSGNTGRLDFADHVGNLPAPVVAGDCACQVITEGIDFSYIVFAY